jgi:hypothetical protein
LKGLQTYSDMWVEYVPWVIAIVLWCFLVKSIVRRNNRAIIYYDEL